MYWIKKEKENAQIRSVKVVANLPYYITTPIIMKLLEDEIGLDNITYYEQDLRRYLLEKLKKISYIDIINEESDSGIIAFNVDGIFSQDIAVYLNKYNICVRAGNHCAKILKDKIGVRNTVRVSLYFYNTKEEIDKLVSLLSDREKILKEMI